MHVAEAMTAVRLDYVSWSVILICCLYEVQQGSARAKRLLACLCCTLLVTVERLAQPGSPRRFRRRLAVRRYAQCRHPVAQVERSSFHMTVFSAPSVSPVRRAKSRLRDFW